MKDKILEYRKAHPRCRYCKYAIQNTFDWRCLAKQKLHRGTVLETTFKGMFCGLFEVTEG